MKKADRIYQLELAIKLMMLTENLTERNRIGTVALAKTGQKDSFQATNPRYSSKFE